jgi:cyclopropane fatty-acyl-phospholipid synthase-like methyltransferase
MANEDVTPEKVGKYYDEWTERYRSSFGDTFQAYRPANSTDLHQYILERAGIRDGDRVLDAGCGICAPSIFFAAHRNVVIDAVTVSERQVETARGLVSQVGLGDKIKVHLADFHRLEDHFSEATFDRAVFLESLSHAAEPGGPLRSVFNVLKPGGVVYIKDFFEKQCDTEEERRLVHEVVERVDRTFALRTPSLQHTVDAITRIGFRQLRAEPIRFTSDNSVWRRFNDAHGFDLYGGKEARQWCDWLELTFERPAG